MATVNQYKFLGSTIATDVEQTLLTPAVASAGSVETVVIKSFRVTNTTANTPTITITNNGFDVINTQTLVAAESVEILTNPMVVEGETVLSYTTVGTVTDGVDITISYLNIKKEVTV